MSFDIAGIGFSDITNAGNGKTPGNYFAVDMLANNGKTGEVAANSFSGAPGPIMGAGLPGLALLGGGLAFAWRLRRRQDGPISLAGV